MIVMDLTPRTESQWVVLDRGQNLVDHGPDLAELYSRHKQALSSLTFYFATAAPKT
jgi:hypothetical protein